MITTIDFILIILATALVCAMICILYSVIRDIFKNT